MADQKTLPTSVDPHEFLASVDPERRRRDGAALMEMMGRITGYAPVMWGPTIIGYGRYDYTYDSGHSGSYFLTGFSPRKANLSIYLLPELGAHSALLAKLGKHKTGVCCLYVNKLADVDMDVLEQLIEASFQRMVGKYGRSS
jgi:hypothetical protein